MKNVKFLDFLIKNYQDISLRVQIANQQYKKFIAKKNS